MPSLPENLSAEEIKILEIFAKSCRKTIVKMVTEAQSGHPGGSLSCIDYLSLLYLHIIGKTGEEIIISNGHISPAVYSILAEMNYIDKEEVIRNFRKIGTIFEGHVTRHVPGVWYGTGPLGVGVSAAAGFALAKKIKKSPEKVFGIMGDGEAQEGQVYEMINFANKYKLNNFILFVDYNEVQLSASLEEIMPLNLSGIFKTANWHVIEADGHDYKKLWDALKEAYTQNDKPVVIIGKTIMGKGVDGMEEQGKNRKSTWHGNAPSKEIADTMIDKLSVSSKEEMLVDQAVKNSPWRPLKPTFIKGLTKMPIDAGKPILYGTKDLTDCRTAYGMALLDLAKRNQNILALTADLRGSVMTKFVAQEISERHIECGIAEQHMISLAGGLSLDGFIPFASTFGAFMSSRAKDQARVNDINQTNVKMVATHCGLSVGEDGPTHQAIDDTGSFLGMFNTMVIEPADPNQTDRIIRYVAAHYGNFYVRMGRHKFPIITKIDGSPFYDENYRYEYGRTDVIREGKDITIIATGAMVHEALKAAELMKKTYPKISLEIIAATSIKKFDENIETSLNKTKKVITVEDHNPQSGLGGQIAKYMTEKKIVVDSFKNLGVTEYQFSGKVDELYKKAGIGYEAIAEACQKIFSIQS